MNNQFEGRSFLKEIDYTPTELAYLIDFASHLKTLKAHHIPHPYLQGKNIALLFEKTSTRTRSAFTVAANDLGANPDFWVRTTSNSGRRSQLLIRRKYWGPCMMVLNFGL